MFLGKFSSIWTIVSRDTRFWELNTMGTVSSIENGSITEITCRAKFACRLLVFILEGTRVAGFLIDTSRGTTMPRCANIFCRSLCFLSTWTEESRIALPRWLLKTFGITIMPRQTWLAASYILVEGRIGISSFWTFFWIICSGKTIVAFGTNPTSDIVGWI